MSEEIDVEGRRDVVTLGKCLVAAKKLKKEGKLVGSRKDKAAAILNELVTADPQAFADPSIDWDAILAFIEKLLPLILTIIGLFA
jgi:hypothetical protein